MGVITEQQLNFLESFGYLRIPGLFVDEIDEITEAFEAVFADQRHNRLDMNEAVHRNDRRIMIPGFIDLHPTLARLRDDLRIIGLALISSMQRAMEILPSATLSGTPTSITHR